MTRAKQKKGTYQHTDREKDREKRYELAGIFAALAIGFILRMLPARNALVDGKVLFYGCDSYYHMRRVHYVVDNFPHDLWFDSYLNYPHGMGLTWPPLFDQLIAGFSLLLGAKDQYSVEIVGALIPPVLGTITILVAYVLARELFGSRAALLSAFVLAISPNHFAKTHFAWTDHHALEVLLFSGAVLFLVLALSGREHGRWFAVVAGVLMAGLAYTWLGAPAYMGIVLVYAVAQLVMDVKRKTPSEDTVIHLATTFGVALILMVPFWDEPWMRSSALSAAGALAVLGLMYLLSYLFVKKNLPWIVFPFAVFLSGYALFIAVYMLGVSSFLQSGLSYFFGGYLSEMVVSEAMPLYAKMDLISTLSFNLMLAFAGIGVLMVHMRRSSDLSRGQLLFLVWAVSALILAFAQNRFLYLFSIGMAILIGVLFFWSRDLIIRENRLEGDALVPLTAALLAIFVLPSAVTTAAWVQDDPEISFDEWPESLGWLEKNTPPTSGFEKPRDVPEYGVLSWWDYGNWILYQSQRPVVANNFQAGALDSARFFLSESEEEALEILDARGVRYVITYKDILYNRMHGLARWAGEEPSTYIMVDERSNGDVAFTHMKRFMGTTLAKLHLLDCKGLGHHRLIYESNVTEGETDPTYRIKIFERVSGARIVGNTPYEQPMVAVLEMTSNQGRRFQYSSYVEPENGRYEITVPYSTEPSYKTRALDVYLVAPMTKTPGAVYKQVEVSEEDVLLGRTIEVDF